MAATALPACAGVSAEGFPRTRRASPGARPNALGRCPRWSRPLGPWSKARAPDAPKLERAKLDGGAGGLSRTGARRIRAGLGCRIPATGGLRRYALPRTCRDFLEDL